MKDKTIQNIANLIIAEARNAGGDDIGRTTYHVHLLVRARVLEMIEKVREDERGAEQSEFHQKVLQDEADYGD